MSDYVIVGAGLTGMMLARELCLAGANVSVLERGEVGKESSWAGGGIISPLIPWRYPEPVSVLARWSQARYPALAQSLYDDTGIDPEYVRNGMLLLGLDDQSKGEVWAAQHDIAFEVLAAAAVAECEPQLRYEGSGMWMPKVAQVRNPRILKALHRFLRDQGVCFLPQTDVKSLYLEQGKVRGVVTEQGVVAAAQVVVTCGAWTQGLLADAGEEIKVEPVRGQMLLFKAPAQWLSRIVLAESCYIIPRRDGHILVGSTMEYVGFDKSTTQAAYDRLFGAAVALLPGLADFPVVHHWAGLRPSSPVGVPYIGAHPNIDGLYVSAGHFRNGVVMGPASARLLADIIMGRPPICDPKPFAIS